jgi:regulator of PEP synthase PpsR (kinase-PPPase family)
MTQPKEVYYISGNTTILAKEMGRALLSQFPENNFIEESLPFIRNIQDAEQAFETINNKSAGNFPIIISSLFSEQLNSVFDRPGVHLFIICDQLLARLESILGTNATRQTGTSRRQDDRALANRVSAIQYTIGHDDGTGINDYDDAELIIVGVSRSGKTPVSVFIATQIGHKTANYPLIDKDLDNCHLPPAIYRNRHKVIGLSNDPKTLNKFRENRFPGSRYAQLSTCKNELRKAARIYQKYSLPVVHSGGSSIEETAMQVINELKTKNSQETSDGSIF